MSQSLPPFKCLVAFDAAARLGSFSKASEALSITQSAISQQLLKLEESVGQKLFLRNGKGVKLTAAGELLYETVRDTLVSLSAGLNRIEPYKSKDSILIACPSDFAHGWLMPHLELLKQAIHPSIEIWIITQGDIREIDRIDVDLVISRRPIYTADIECTVLFEDYAMAICGPETAKRVSQMTYPKVLENIRLLMLESEPAWGGRLSALELKGLNLTRGATMDDSRILLEAVMREQGVGFVSRALAYQALKERKVHMLAQIPTVSRPRLWLMRTRLSPRTPFSTPAFNWLSNLAKQC